MTRLVKILGVVCAVAAGAPAVFAQSVPAIHDVSGSFPRGPYTTVSIAAGDPLRVAVGTENGVVGWSHDGGDHVDTSDAIIYRKMDPVTLRGTGGYGALAVSGTPVRSPTSRSKSARHPAPDATEGGEDDSVRSIYQFQQLLGLGLPGGRYALWMANSDPVPNIGAIAVPSADGPLAVAATGGIYVSDGSRGSWMKSWGYAQIMPRDHDPIGLTVGIDPRDPRHVLAGTSEGLQVSRDGGTTFLPHRAASLEGAWINKISWDPNNPDLVFLVTAEQIFLSQDGGVTFEPSFSAEGEIRDLALSPDAAIVATSDGVYLAYADRLDHQLDGKDLIGAVAWEGGVLAATAEELMLLRPDGKVVHLRNTTMKDPYLRLAGSGTTAWLLSRDNVLRLGDVRPRTRRKAPRMLLGAGEVVDAMLDHLNFHFPKDFRALARKSKLLPHLDVTANGRIGGDDSRVDDATFPVAARYLRGGSHDRFEWTAWVSWELDALLFNQLANPNLIIPSQIREKRKAVIDQVQKTYREASQLAVELGNPPADEEAALNQRFRFAEMIAYLEFMCGRPMVADFDLEHP